MIIITTVRHGISRPRRAIVGNKVAGASLCSSTPSRTRTNLSMPSNRRSKELVRLLKFSHREVMMLSNDTSFTFSTASIHAASVRSRRWRPVIHSEHGINACLRPESSRYAFSRPVFPVDSDPWTINVPGLWSLGYCKSVEIRVV